MLSRRQLTVGAAACLAALLGLSGAARGTALVAVNGHFLNDPAQPYPDDPRLQYDSRLMFRNTINGGAVAIGPEWILHSYHAQFPANGGGVDGYVGQLMDQFDNQETLLGSYRAIASRESAALDYAVLRIEKVVGASGEPAALPLWVDPRELQPAQPGIALWGSFGPQRILIDGGGQPVQDPPHPRGLKWGTTGSDGFLPTGLPSDVQEVSGDSGSGIFLHDGFNLRLLAVNGDPITAAVQEQIGQWVAQMGGTLTRPALQVGTYSTARLAGTGEWDNAIHWTQGVPDATSTAWLDGGTVLIAGGGAVARNLYVGVGQQGLVGSGTLQIVAETATLAVGSLLMGVTEGDGTVAFGVIHQSAGTVSAGTGVIGYRGIGQYTLTGGALEVDDLTLGRDRDSIATLTMQTSGGAGPSLNVTNLVIGREGSGVFSQAGGIVDVSNSLHIGRFSPAIGGYELTDGSLNVGSTLVIGNAAGALGTLSMSGGQLSVARGSVQRGWFDMSGGQATILFADVAASATMRLSGGLLSMSEGGIATGTLDFAGTTTEFAAGGILDLSAGTIVDATNATLNALPGSLVILPSGFGVASFGTVSSAGAIVQPAGTTITIGGTTSIRGYGTIRDFVNVEGSLSAVAGVAGSDLVLLKGFNAASGSVIQMGAGGNAFISQPSANDGGSVAGGSLRLSSSLVQTAGALDLAGQLRIQPSATLSLLGGEISAASLDIRGTLIQSAGTVSISGETFLLGNFTQTSGHSTYAQITSLEPPPVTSVVNISGGSMTVDAIHASALSVTGSGLVQIDPQNSLAVASVVKMLSVSLDAGATAMLDLGQEKLIVDYTADTPLQQLTLAVQAGYANGAWTGNGISSAAAAAAPGLRAVGIAEAAQIGVSEFGGYDLTDPANPTAPITAVLMAYTWAGDANLDGTVSISDFALLAGNFNTSGNWAGGDFDYDGMISLSDFAILAGNFNLADRPAGAIVPEAAMVPALACAFALAGARRGRPSARLSSSVEQQLP